MDKELRKTVAEVLKAIEEAYAAKGKTLETAILLSPDSEEAELLVDNREKKGKEDQH